MYVLVNAAAASGVHVYIVISAGGDTWREGGRMDETEQGGEC